MSKLRKILIGELSWKRMMLSIISIYLMLMTVAIFFAHKLIFFPPGNHYGEDLPNLHFVEDGRGAKIAYVHYKATPGMPTILWTHGNAEDIGLLSPIFEEFHSLGLGVLAYDYPGYGLSTGTAKEKTCYQAADMVWDHMTGKLNIHEKDIVLLGQSVGSGPTIYLAEKHQSSSVVLIAPLTSVYRVGVKYPIFPFDQFPNIGRIKNVSSPLLVLHGEQDSVIPQNHGQRLIDAHPGESQFVNLPNTNHNDIYYLHMPLVVESISTFAMEHHSASKSTALE